MFLLLFFADIHIFKLFIRTVTHTGIVDNYLTQWQHQMKRVTKEDEQD
jgi:hypothetical protein